MGSKSASTGGNDLFNSISESYHALVTKLIHSLPDFLGAAVLILIGWLVAYGVKILILRIVAGLDSVIHPLLRSETKRSGLSLSYAAILSRVAFWAVMLFFAAAASNMVGWTFFTGWMENVVAFLPSLFAGLLIIFAGIFLGSGAKSFATRAAASARMEQPAMIGRITQLVVVFTMVVVGVEQFGVNIHFLTNILNVVIGVLLAGGALAFGLGARRLVANVIGVQYCRKFCRVGQELSIGGIDGVVVEITQTAIVLETATGQAVVPASLFNEQISNFSGNSSVSDSSDTKTEQKNDGDR